MSDGCRDFQCLPRRSLLKIGGVAGFGGLSLPALLRAEAAGPRARAKHIVFLHQWGGPSHHDTFDMKPDAPDGIRGEFQPIASDVPGVVVSEHLPRWSKLIGKCALVRSVNHRMKNHNSAGYYSLSGHAPPVDDQRLRDSVELYPACGSTVARFRPVDDPAVPTFVSFPYVIRDGSPAPGQGASFLGKQFDPFFIGQDPSRSSFRLPELSLPASTPLERLEDRRGLLRLIDQQAEALGSTSIARGIDSFYDRALGMLASPKVKRAFDLSREPDKVRDAYGRDSYGQSCLLARRLIEAGTRFVTVYYANSIGGAGSGGWDTHQDNFTDLKKRLLPSTDRAVPTLLEDLDTRGLLDETLVVWMGEFGRSPRIGDRDGKGRGHWPQCYTAVFAGGGIRGGAVYGSSDRIGAYPSTDPVRPDDLAATMYWALGLDPATEFRDTLDRPLPIAAGKPITEIFG